MTRCADISGRGFTLVELLIAISLLGLIGVVTYSAIWTASRSLQTVEARVEQGDAQRVTQEFLRQSLTQARGVMAINDGVMQLVFSGEEKSLSYVAPAPLQRGRSGGLYRYRLDVSGGGEAVQALNLSYWPHLAGVEFDAALPPQGESLLLEQMAEISFSYYGRDEPGAAAGWMTVWPRGDTLPQLVSIRLRKSAMDEASVLTVVIKGRVG